MNEQSLYFKQGPNLAVYRLIGEHQQFWERRWQATNIAALLKSARAGRLGELEKPFLKYLPRDGIALEAGCGPGRIVCALQARGYTVEGIDYAAETIQRLRSIDPSLNVRSGDIFAIDRPDGYYAAYISLGVLEHYIDGPQAGLAEAWRILRPDGVAFILVPYLNHPRRRIYQRAPDYKPQAEHAGYRFYQYQEDIADFSLQLARAGFKVIETLPCQLFEGLTSDWRLGRWLQRRHFFSWKISQMLRSLCERLPRGLQLRYSHMLLYVCAKRQ